MKSDNLKKLIKKDGKRIKGSHYHFKHSTKKGIVTLPNLEKNLPKKTINSILKQMEFKIKIVISKIIVYVEKTNDGIYWKTSQNYQCIVFTFGNTFEQLKTNFEQAIHRLRWELPCVRF